MRALVAAKTFRPRRRPRPRPRLQGFRRRRRERGRGRKHKMKKTIDKLKRGQHVTIVAFGDSNTAETFHTRGHMTWPSLLAEAIFEAYGTGVCTMINTSVCGTGFGDSIARLERDVYRFKPDLVIVCFGVGAANHGLEKLDLVMDGMRQLIRAIQQNCGCEILVRTPN